MVSFIKKIRNKIKLSKKHKKIDKLVKKNNIINIDKNDLCYVNLNICGENNSVIIKKLSNFSKGIININITGSNNKIFIDENVCVSTGLNINIGNSHYNYIDSKDIEIKIGKYTTFELTYISGVNFGTKIEIGEKCMFSFDTKLINSDFHPIYDNETKQIVNYVKDLKIGNHCWLGTNSIVLKNIILQDNTVVGAGAIVTKSFNEGNIIIAGNPAVIKKKNIIWSDSAHEYCVNNPLSNIKVISPEKTIEKIIKDKTSICRFGDGEFRLLQGKDLDFEIYSEKIEQALKNILHSNNDNILVGINYHLFYPLLEMRNINAFWTKHYIKNNIDIIKSMLKKGKTYYSSEFTSMYAIMDNTYNYEEHFNNLRKIWDKRDIVLVHGKGIFNNIQYNIFDNVSSIVKVEAPNKNAFEDYNKIYEEIKKESKEKLIILILGPAATVLAYELAKEGYQAIDLGHAAKDYDWYKKGVKPDEGDNVAKFYSPD